MKKIYWIILIVLVALGLIALGVFLYIQHTKAELSKKRQNLPETPSGVNCKIDTANWQSYDGGEYTIKYPSDWFNNTDNSKEGDTYWFVSFGPNDLAPLVYIGGNARDLDQFKQDLIGASGPGFQIKNEEKETVSGVEATKFSVEGGSNYPYLTYIYYITLGNIPVVIKGPAESDHFASSCEPEIFAEMIKNYNFRGMGSWNGSENNLNDQTYTDTDCGFSFQYPSDWDIIENYYYETAGGEKANVPTIILAKKGNADTSKNIIIINPRQGFCMETADSVKTKEVLLPNSSFVADLVSYPGQNISCEEATREGKDKNGKTADYHFYSVYDNDSGIKDIFKQVFLSFTVPD